MSAASLRFSATSAPPFGRLPARSLPRAEQRLRRRVAPMPSSMSRRSLQRAVSLVRDHVDVASTSRPSGSSMARISSRRTPAVDEPFARSSSRPIGRLVAGATPRRARGPRPVRTWLARLRGVVSGGPMSAIIHARVVEHLQRLRLASSPSDWTRCSMRPPNGSRPISISSTRCCDRRSRPNSANGSPWACRLRTSRP